MGHAAAGPTLAAPTAGAEAPGVVGAELRLGLALGVFLLRQRVRLVPIDPFDTHDPKCRVGPRRPEIRQVQTLGPKHPDGIR
jgi:hypothetical protein